MVIIMKLIFLILLVFGSRSFSQSQLEFGRVKADKHFSCESPSFLDRFDSLQAICKSENQLELRLRISYNPTLNYALIVVTYNGKTWTATKYESTNMSKPKPFKLQALKAYDSIFLELKRNNIFLLPNQSKISHKVEVLDGVGYHLTFKAGNKFRQFEFDNPSDYSQNHKDVKAFQNYNNIVEILTTWFVKQ
jgi:hypothetical protein